MELNVAPSIMRTIVEATLSKDDAIQQATLAYIDDVFINENIVSATRVRQQPHILTQCSVFSFFGKLVGHFPVVKWLRVAAAFIKRRAMDMMKGWDDKVIDVPLISMIKDVFVRVCQKDPVWATFGLMQIPWSMMKLLWRTIAGCERRGIRSI